MDMVLPLVISFLLCLLIIKTKGLHYSRSADSCIGKQKFHSGDIPRIGGVAIFSSVTIYMLFVQMSPIPIVAALLLGSLPAFIVGIWEDFFKSLGPYLRFLVTVSSGVITYWLTGIVIQYVGLSGVDDLLQYQFIAVAFTTFAIGGVTNAFNIIDGFNGLSSGVAVKILLTISLIALQLNDTVLVQMCMVLIFAILGFFIFNFPYGKIFLGDGGAYFIGFCIAWVLILLPYRNPDVLPFASLLMCSYPIIEVCYSIVRKTFSTDGSPFKPDGLHLHTLVYKKITSRMDYVSTQKVIKNSLVSPFMWLFNLFPCSIALMYYDNKVVMVLGFITLVCLYHILYKYLLSLPFEDIGGNNTVSSFEK